MTEAIEAEILIIINSIVQKCDIIQKGEYSTKAKDDAKHIVIKSLDICIKELDPKLLIQLENIEIMKIMKHKMVNNLG